MADAFRPAQRVGLWAGGIVFVLLLLLPAPEGLTTVGWRTAAAATLMAIWWMTEAIPIPATALIPLVLFPILGILTMPEAAAPYANEVIYLFLGGFLLALAVERWGLHRRIALGIMIRVGSGPRQLVLGFMVATAFLSMWISNTATTTMMLPIALAVGEMLRPRRGSSSETGIDPTVDASGEPYHFGIALMMGVAYAASIGGVATLIGTPPNAVFAGAAQEMLGVRIGFLQWMIVGVPVSVVMLPAAWAILVFLMHRPGPTRGDAEEVLERERSGLGPWSRGERIVGTVFLLTALGWLLREPKGALPGIATFAPRVLDSTIAMTAALLLFLIPVDFRKRIFALDWHTARKAPWGILILFGGGLSLARAMDQSGLASWIGGSVAGLADVPAWVLAMAVATLFVLVTEVTSNTASATMAMPVMAGAAAGLGAPPLVLMSTAALAASMAFMLPVATPPNAIVFSSGYLTIPQMARVGALLNVVSVIVVTVTATLLTPVLFG